MAKRRPYTTNPTTGAQEWLPSADALDAKINVSGPNKILGRTTTGEGGHEELTIAGLPAETTPASGDLLLIEVAGVLSKLDIANLPAGGSDSLGTGFTSGGGSGTIPDGTVADFEDGFSSFEWSGGSFPSGFLVNQAKYGDGTLHDYGSGALYLGTKGAGVGIQFWPDEGRLAMIGDDGSTGSVDLVSLAISGITFKGVNAGDLSPVASLSINESDGAQVRDFRTGSELGLTYYADYSAAIATNDRSIPDVGTVNLLKQTPVSYANGDAPNNCIFYSTTNSKLAYKDSGGTVNNLY